MLLPTHLSVLLAKHGCASIADESSFGQPPLSVTTVVFLLRYIAAPELTELRGRPAYEQLPNRLECCCLAVAGKRQRQRLLCHSTVGALWRGHNWCDKSRWPQMLQVLHTQTKCYACQAAIQKLIILISQQKTFCHYLMHPCLHHCMTL